MSKAVGKPLNRVDGRLKVTGKATYAAEFKVSNPAYAVLVQSAIAKGRIRNIDTRAAETAPGVLAVITYKNMPRLKDPGDTTATGSKPGEQMLPLQSDTVHYAGQHIGVVVADTLERAEHAARLVQVSYNEQQPATQIEKEMRRAYQPEKFFGMEDMQIRRGNAGRAIASSAVKLEHTYTTPVEHHNPMEPHSTIAVWEGDSLTIYDATQAVMGACKIFANVLNLPEERVRVISPFVGGGFGCKGLVWYHPVLAAVAARQVKRPVKLVLARQQMFTSNGHRGRTIQQLALGAGQDGRLAAVRHITTTHTSQVDEFVEPAGLTTRMLYACPNLEMTHNAVRLNVGTPTPMRAPGESPGTFALESALDELAYELQIDPIELRLRNHADVNPQTNKPWSSKYLKECYWLGAEKFGWSRRNPKPGSMRDGRYLIGMGMATATYPGYRTPASARVRIMNDGSAIASSATQDLGTGTYTVMTQIAADALGLPLERVRFELGDSRLPPAPVSGGSQTVASVAPAVQRACEMARAKVVQLALADKESPLFGRSEQDIDFADGRLFPRGEPSRGETYAAIVSRQRLPMVEACVTTPIATAEAQSEARNPAVRASSEGQGGASSPPCSPVKANSDMDANQDRYAFQSFGAQFCEVRVDPDFGTVRVTRFTSVHDVGRVLNEKTARSQVHGGVIYGVGMALMEETLYDPRNGRPVVRNLADYHVPVNADVPFIDVYFIGKPDSHINTIGARGIGEIGITGVAAAVANAVYHATGKRVRDLPITPDKLL